MPKLNAILPKIFGNSKSTKETKSSNGVGRLVRDALPLDNEQDNNANGEQQSSSSLGHTPSVSAELTASAVRELSDPNYNSANMRLMPSSPQQNSNIDTLAERDGTGIGGPVTNMNNIHAAQQQVFMQFSNSSNLHFGSVYNFNGNLSAVSSRKNSTTEDVSAAVCGSTEGSSGKRPIPRKTTTIVAMMQSQDEPNHRMLDTIATHLGEGWKEVMRDLGLSEGEIEQAIIDHQMHGGIKEVIYQLLLKWIQGADDGVATLGRITDLLWQKNYRECVERMKMTWKREMSKNKAS